MKGNENKKDLEKEQSDNKETGTNSKLDTNIDVNKNKIVDDLYNDMSKMMKDIEIMKLNYDANENNV
jgi:sortase (surface protein transpeptidase)